MFERSNRLARAQRWLHADVVLGRFAVGQSPGELIDGAVADAYGMNVDRRQIRIQSGQQRAFVIARDDAQIAANLRNCASIARYTIAATTSPGTKIPVGGSSSDSNSSINSSTLSAASTGGEGSFATPF